MTLSDESLIRRAAEAEGVTVTDFIVRASTTTAREVLADRRVFLLDDEKWEELQVLLNRPTEYLPKLGDLLSREPVWNRDN